VPVVYGNRYPVAKRMISNMDTLVVKPVKTLKGNITVPGDKSISHRAAILSSLARGTTRVHNFLTAADCLSTVQCLRKLGVDIEGPENNTLIIKGKGFDGLKEPEDVIDAGNSGTTMRLMTGVLASLTFFSVITGDDSLRRRPMDRVINPLSRMGAIIAGRSGNSKAPLAITGQKLRGIKYNSPVASAQVKSAILLAALRAEGETTVIEPALSRDHSERMLQHFGVRINKKGPAVSVTGPCTLETGGDFTVPGDISSAAFFIVAASLVPGSEITVTGVGINPTRTGIIDVLREMGANIIFENERAECGEPVADIRILHAPLRGTHVGGDIIPRLIDEIPVLAVAAAVARGETRITGAEELKYKETDRIKAVAEELQKLGARVEELPDGLAITGVSELKGAHCHSRGDHRMAMALAVAALLATGETVIEQASSITVSFPEFFNVLNSLTVE